jgi:hypothetical protein
MEYPVVNVSGKLLIASFLFKEGIETTHTRHAGEDVVSVINNRDDVLIDGIPLDLECEHFQAVMEWMFTNDYGGLHRCLPCDYCLDPWTVVRRRIIDAFMVHVHQDTVRHMRGATPLAPRTKSG